MKATVFIVLYLCLIAIFPHRCPAADNSTYEPNKYGISAIMGTVYDPADNIFFGQVSFSAIFDYDRIWRHRAPDNLRFKVAAAVGLAHLDSNNVRFIANTNILALYYLDLWTDTNISPFVEAGIGLIYTDYTVTGQAYRYNFNPQAGIGIEIKRRSGQTNFLALRMHHLSNSGINHDNRGQNSLILVFGQYF